MGAGAALALAPLASADPTEITNVINSEIASMNSTFEFDAALAGVTNVDKATAAGSWDTIPVSDLTNSSGDPTEISKLLFGSDPLANASSDPGAYDLYNGAMAEYDNAFNVELYALLNNGDLIPASDLFGSESVINGALTIDGAATTAAEAAQAFSNAGWDDMLGYFSLPWP